MIYYENGDIVNDDYPFFCQQVNCKGVMGSGLAKQIRDKYPYVYTEYRELVDRHKNLLGHIQLVHMTGVNQRICINMFSQDGYGRDKQYTDYDAFRNCLDVIANELMSYSPNGHYHTIAFPYKIGCGLAGGDWNIIKKMLEEFSEKVEQKVVVVTKENG